MRIVPISCILLILCTNILAANMYFTNESGDNLWTTPGNWRDGSWIRLTVLPDFSTHTININNDVHPRLTSSSTVKYLYCPYSNTAGTTTGFEITGNLTVSKDFVLGVYNDTTGVVDINTGSVYVGGIFTVGSGGSHVLNVRDASINTAQLYLTQFNADAAAQMNVSGNSTVTVRTKFWAGFGSKYYWNTYGYDSAHLDISGAAAKVITPYAQQVDTRGYVNIGIITANGGTGKVVLTPNPLANTATLTAVDKPSSIDARIMPLGDSITYGIGSTPSGLNGYRKPLYQMLTENGYNVEFVGSQFNGDFNDCDHEGYPGWFSYQIRDNVYNWLINNPADVVLLHIGTNDIVQGTQDPAIIGQILDNIDSYESSQNRQVIVLVARIILEVGDVKTSAFNSAVAALVQNRIANGDLLAMVDLEHALNYSTDMADTLHPNDNGYLKMAQQWYNALSNVVTTECQRADINSNNNVNFVDYAKLVENWMQEGTIIDGDIDNDSNVDLYDLSLMAKYWLCSCQNN